MISIIIPTYNSAATIEKCLHSVVSQTFTDWEVLIFDAMSKDGTLDIAHSVNDERIRIYAEPDEGVYDAMNKGIDKAKGDWLYFLGSDDYLYSSTSLTEMNRYLDDNFDVVYGEVDSDLGEMHRGEWTVDKIMYNRCHQCIFYNKRFFSSGLRYNLNYRILADYDLNLKWILDKKYTKKHVPVVVAHYNTTGMSSYTNDEVFDSGGGESNNQI